MEVTETQSEGLRREYRIVVPATDIAKKVESRLSEIGGRVRLPGFRPGRVPMAILKKRYGRSVMGEVLEQAVNDATQKTISERGIRPALQPKIEVTRFDEGSDLEYTMAVELMPEIDEVDLGSIKLERLVAEVPEEMVEDRLRQLAESTKTFKTPDEPRPAQAGDQVVIDFKGTVDGEAKPGLSAEGHVAVLGAGRLIPGFEEQLIGHSAGDRFAVEVTFPEDYHAQDLAGKAASFDVEIKEVREPEPVEIDDAWAQKGGFENLEALRGRIRSQFEAEFARASRARLKRQLLDRLAERYHFTVPVGMVDLEFETIWRQVQEALKAGDSDDPDLQKPEEQLREEYRAIAERRVRLGLLLSEVGRLNNLSVGQDELNRAMLEETRRYPGREQEVINFFRSNKQAVENLRAPLFEDKVVDFIVGMAEVTERTVPVEELMRDPDEPAAEPAAAGGPEPAPADAAPEGAAAEAAEDAAPAEAGPAERE